MMTRYEQEWQYRKAVMEAILDVLQDGKPRTAREILHSLPVGAGLKVNTTLVNSILFSEGKRYAVRDNRAYTYRIRKSNEAALDLPPWDLARDRIFHILKYSGRLTVSELNEELESDGMPILKWMIKAIMSKDDFRFAVSIADNDPVEQEPNNRELDRLWGRLLEDF